MWPFSKGGGVAPIPSPLKPSLPIDKHVDLDKVRGRGWQVVVLEKAHDRYSADNDELLLMLTQEIRDHLDNVVDEARSTNEKLDTLNELLGSFLRGHAGIGIGRMVERGDDEPNHS